MTSRTLDLMRLIATITAIFFLLSGIGTVCADTSASSTVFMWNEEQEVWEELTADHPDHDAAKCTVREPQSRSGHAASQMVPFLTTASVDIPDSINPGNPGRLTLTVTPLSSKITPQDSVPVVSVTGDPEQLPEGASDFSVRVGEKAQWEFKYHLQNMSNKQTMYAIEVWDIFGAELAEMAELTIRQDTMGNFIIDEVYHGPGDCKHATVIAGQQGAGEMSPWTFKWTDFTLGPGGWAELTIQLENRKNPGDQQLYTACGMYALNSGAKLKYKTDPNHEGWSSRYGREVRVEVPCYLFVEIGATNVTWYLRKPGDYYIKALEGRVESSHNVVVTFSEFDNLQCAENNQSLPVFYALDTEHPEQDDWMDPQQLNAKDPALKLILSDGEARWNMWQMVVLDTQYACEYSDKGVITFTINNQ